MAGLVAQVLVVAAGVAVRDEPIHRRGQPDARREARDDQHQPRDVERAAVPDAVQSLAEQTQRRRRQHQARAQPQDPVVGPARQIAHEEERQRAQAGGQPGQRRGEHARTHGRDFYIVSDAESNAQSRRRA